MTCPFLCIAFSRFSISKHVKVGGRMAGTVKVEKSIFRKHMVRTEYLIKLVEKFLPIFSTLCKAVASWYRMNFNKCHIFTWMAYF